LIISYFFVCADILVAPSEPTNQNFPSHTDVQRTVDNTHSAKTVQPVIPTVEVTDGSPTPGSDANTALEHFEDWDTEDTASMSDTASISSGCSSVGSQGGTVH
jgi:hypothetical protein